MRTTFKLIPLFLGLLIFTQCKNRDENVDTELALPVSVMNVKTGSIEKFVNATGTVNATQVAELKSEITGKYILQTNPLTGKPFHLGDKVKEGQLIIKIEDKEFENNLNMESKKLNLEVSKQEYQKQESLYKKGGVTLRELRNSEISYINAQNSYENALLSMEKIEVRAPMSGIFFRKPAPDQPAYVEVGDSVKKKQVLALLETMKVFQKVKSPANGKILEIVAQNEKPLKVAGDHIHLLLISNWNR
jgi:biotin carboxyl carrier protein